MVRDIRYALRSLGRDRAFAAFAIVILALGIGASSIVFNVANALVLRPLPFADPEELVWIANGTSENLSAQTAQVMNLAELERGSTVWQGIAGFSPFYGAGDIRLGAGGEPERVTGVPVTQNFFSLLGVEPVLGRGFTTEESQFNGPKAIVLSHAFWRARFAADPSVIGRAVTIDGAPATIVGVMRPSFDFAGTFTPGAPADLFVPFPLTQETNRQGNTLALVGRLKPGADLAAAQAQATVVGGRIVSGRLENYWRNTFRPRLSPLRERVVGRFLSPIGVLGGAVGILMLLVCANLSNLLLVRAAARRRDVAVRAALGASRAQLLRQMLIEALTLAIVGAATGLLLAVAGTRAIAQLETAVPLLYTVRIDVAALTFIVGATAIVGVAFGVLPAFQASRTAPQAALQHFTRGTLAGGSWTQRVIVVAEVAIVCVLVSGSGLLARSFVRVMDVDLGFDASHVAAVRVDPRREGSTRASRNAYFDSVIREASSVPGIEAVGLSDALPLGDNFGWRRWTIRKPDGSPERYNPLVRMIDEGYLAAMKIPIVAGRGFTAADSDASEPVMIINDALAAEIWPGEDPLGRQMHVSGKLYRIVGLVRPVTYFAVERESGGEMYLPMKQAGDYAVVDLVMRTAMPSSMLTGNVRAALKRADPNMPLTDIRTMAQLIDRSLFARRALLWVVAGFAAFGLVLASLGLYAVIAYSVGQRQSELGLRMALGASPSELRSGVLAQTLSLVIVGLIAGLPASWMAGQVMQGLLFQVAFADAATYVGMVVVLVMVAGVAGYLPARRASRVDPAIALRAQ